MCVNMHVYERVSMCVSMHVYEHVCVSMRVKACSCCQGFSLKPRAGCLASQFAWGPCLQPSKTGITGGYHPCPAFIQILGI